MIVEYIRYRIPAERAPEFEAAWTDAFAVLAGLMIEGASSVDESAA